MHIYSISYSTLANDMTYIEAASEEEAIEIFEKMSLSDLFETKDLLRGIEVNEVEKL